MNKTTLILALGVMGLAIRNVQAGKLRELPIWIRHGDARS